MAATCTDRSEATYAIQRLHYTRQHHDSPMEQSRSLFELSLKRIFLLEFMQADFHLLVIDP
eukprot:5041786-Amphidinium_carterae.1